MEAQLCRDGEVVVIGGGNSAGQAAVFLAQHTSGVHMLVRSGVLADTMSRYLVQRIESSPQVHVHYGSELTSVDGDGELERVSWMNKTSGESHFSIDSPCIRNDRGLAAYGMAVILRRTRSQGIILSGRDLDTATPPISWPLKRAPYMLGNQPSRRVRGWRCSRKQHQASRICCRRRIDRDSYGPSRTGRIVAAASQLSQRIGKSRHKCDGSMRVRMSASRWCRIVFLRRLKIHNGENQ